MVVSRVRAQSGGWHEVVHAEPLPQVASEAALWHSVKVSLLGAQLTIAVDGSPATTLVLTEPPGAGGAGSFASRRGFAGLLTHCQIPMSNPWLQVRGCQAVFRNFTVEGTGTTLAWDETAAEKPSSRATVIRAATVGASCSTLARDPASAELCLPPGLCFVRRPTG